MRDVAFVVYESCQLLDLAGPREVLATANHLLARPTSRYRLHTVATTPAVRAACGQRLATDPVPDGRIHTLVVVGSATVERALANGDVVGLVRELAARSGRVTSVCSGALLLAEAGLLRGRRATTHWAVSERLAGYDGVQVDPDRIFVRDGRVWTAAGVTAGIDLALALIEHDHGSDLARQVAGWLVVYLRRGGGQSQFSHALQATACRDESLRAVLAHIEEHPDTDLSVSALARRMGLSERHLLRVFTAETRMSPGRYVERARLAVAQRLLETTDDTLDVIARRCGIGDAASLHRLFRRALHTTPGAYRRHFTRKAD